jgi:hypothetical protein
MVTRIAKPEGSPAEPHAAVENLDALVQEAVVLDTTPSPLEAKQQAVQEQQQAEASRVNVELIFSGLKLARNMARPRFEWWKEFGEVWGDDTLRQQAEALDEFGTLMGWDAGQILDRFAPYIKLAYAFGVPAWATYQAIELRRAELLAQERQVKPEASDGGQQ